MAIPKRVSDRLHRNLKPFQLILAQQRARDVSEADTVTLVKDILSSLFGYDKYSELTSEYAIRGTYCDLAVRVGEKLTVLIEVKAIGLDLRDSHTKQAVDYAANQGCEWVVLTNGIDWHLYQVLFKKPIDKQEIAHFNLLTINGRSQQDLDRLFLLTKEGFSKNAIVEYRDRKDATSRFLLGAIVTQSEAVLGTIRREVRRVSDILVDTESVQKILREEVIKRETLEGEQADAAIRRFAKAGEKSRRQTVRDKSESTPRTAHPELAPVALIGPS